MGLAQSTLEWLQLQMFAPHGVCLTWSAPLMWMYIISDSLIALAYFSIPFALFYFVKRRPDIGSPVVFILFALFILACGTTHLMDVWKLWRPNYWTDALIRNFTAVISMGTAVFLWVLMPKLLAIPSPLQLREKNATLEKEVNERISAERKLKDSQQRFKSAFDNAPIGIALVDRDGSLLDVNDALCTLVGYTKDELRQLRFQTITYADDLELDLALLEEMLEGKRETYQLEKRYIHKNGNIIWALLSVSAVYDAAGHVDYFISQIQDISEQKRASEELETYSEKLAQSNRDLEDFAYVASHDLQEPLRMISSYTQLLDKRYSEKLDERAKEYIHFAVDGATRMQKLITGLLEYSRVSSRAKPFSYISSEDALKDALANLEMRIKETKAEVKYAKLPDLRGDRAQLAHVFQNLISNALKFQGDRFPDIHVSAKCIIQNKKHVWCFAVEDNGIGIEEEHLERIFTLFQRLHNRDKYKGTGIGLAFCRRIIERHNGTIWAESKINKGTTFFFTIPSAG